MTLSDGFLRLIGNYILIVNAAEGATSQENERCMGKSVQQTVHTHTTINIHNVAGTGLCKTEHIISRVVATFLS